MTTAVRLLKLVEKVFAQDGVLSRVIPNYQSRQEQRDMALQVMEAFIYDRILLCEAPTGTGKTFAYLVPMLLWAQERKGRGVVSTYTIALQEQLIKKDIPFLLKTLNLNIQVTLVKGMGNYFCMRKAQEVVEEKELLPSVQQEELERLLEFSRVCKEGSISEVTFPVSSQTWERVAAERLACTHIECPHFKNCFFFKARKQMADSHVLVVNHHLLATDLAARLDPNFDEERALLPTFSKVVLDEAHHLEDVALEKFATAVNRQDCIRVLNRIYAEKHIYRSRWGLLKADLAKQVKQLPSSLITLLDFEIPARKKTFSLLLEDLFNKIELFCREEIGNQENEDRWRLTQDKVSSSSWKEQVAFSLVKVEEEWRSLSTLIQDLKKHLETEFSDAQKEFFSSHFSILTKICDELEMQLEQIKQFILEDFVEGRVRWVECRKALASSNTTIVRAQLDVSSYLKQFLFQAKQTAVLCSATLSSNKNFKLLKEQIGISEGKFSIEEKIYPSPFNFADQMLFLVPEDAPLPQESTFVLYCVEMIKDILRLSQGGCFVLFTSYEMMQRSYDLLLSFVDTPDLHYLKQGDASKHELIERFKSRSDSVLFATASFWEGVDIPGSVLRCVILPKLPFKVPSEPLFQAMSEFYAKKGKDPFSGYSLPLACLKFKQGIGRLIRTKEDRGCIICLDKRVVTKSYAGAFLNSLPPCPVFRQSSSEVLGRIRDFYLHLRVNENPIGN